MKLSEILIEDNIIPELKAKDKKGVLEELAEVIVHREPSVDKNSLVRVLLERERLGSTGIGDGVAIPHGKFHSVSHPIISFGRSRKGLDFESMDGEPAYLFFLLVAPENSASVHLKALAKIARILKNSAFRKFLMEAPTKEELYRTIIQHDDEF
ncbi:MAG: PTS sugar transporter subunit IIA [Deltaproteobacteria bacterium]|nr:PTS sugar transporter subunit IIA [Deltaproteobacteria bacterium]